MNAEELNKLIESIKVYAEAFGGMRKALINQGFSEDAAEQLCLITAENNGGKFGA